MVMVMGGGGEFIVIIRRGMNRTVRYHTLNYSGLCFHSSIESN